MKLARIYEFLGLAVLSLVLAVGCATAPTQEMSDARQAIQAARDAGAAKHAPDALGSAEQLLGSAENSIEGGNYDGAREDAVAAKMKAVSARNIALAIGAAEAALNEANKMGAEWRDSRKMLDKARAAAKAGDESSAVKIANKAKQEGEMAVAQYYLESAKQMLADAAAYKGSMDAGQMARYMEAEQALANQNGRQAYDILSGLLASLRSGKMDSYNVVGGDSLWRISGKTQVYADPYRWPMIYKANTDRIKDADLIYPGQDLRIRRGQSAAEVNAAVQHARTRGAWSIGRVEDSDRAYLNR